MAERATSETESDALVRSVGWTLKIVFGVVPIVAGLDKYFNLLVVWEKYLARPFASLIPMSPSGFMHLVGIIEIVAGIGVLFTPWTRVFAWIVAIWLWCIAIDLIAGGFYDIAVRDIVMGISSLCLARLTASMPVRAGVKDASAVRTEVHA
jgi:uncharacterized membrane protein YphA (DoxX/SURF4 family)